jgi:hypothetical protein
VLLEGISFTRIQCNFRQGCILFKCIDGRNALKAVPNVCLPVIRELYYCNCAETEANHFSNKERVF